MTSKQPDVFFDVECYPNYFLIIMKPSFGKIRTFELDEDNNLDLRTVGDVLRKYKTIGFNSRAYDIPMIMYALLGKNNPELKALSDEIISSSKGFPYEILKAKSLFCSQSYDHIDLINVANGIKTGLKVYGARMHAECLQDLPYDPSIALTQDQKEEVKKYCLNDVNITIALYNKLSKSLAIRENINKEFNVDVRSKSDAQIAEVLIGKKLGSANPIAKEYEFKYNPPSYIEFHNPELKNLMEKITSLVFKGGVADKLFHSDIPKTVVIKDTSYGLGVGGLHSQEKERSIVVSEDEYLIDVDVSSYYPSIILNNEYAPQQFDKKEFLDLYNGIRASRLKAKDEGNKDKADVYKIILNGSFGKFGDQYSHLYSPELLVHTTLTGQLSLLMLIERLEEHGFKVISANTDGVMCRVKIKEYELFSKVIKYWEKKTNLQLEETRNKALYSQSVNSYIAVKEDGKLKCKGAYIEGDLVHNPSIKVCLSAVINYLVEGTSIEDSIYGYPTDPKNFVMIKSVKTKGGAYWRDQPIGKVVRWYWSTVGEAILRKPDTIEFKKDGTPKKEGKVPGSEGAYPIMDLKEKLTNIDYGRYIDEAYKMLNNLGVKVECNKEKRAA